MKNIYVLKGSEVRGVPNVISVLPLGHVTSSKGEFDVDEESLAEMKAQIARRGVDLVIDYEHQTLKGIQAPAAGWVKELKIEDGYIRAVAEWTEQAQKYLKNKEYRYLSPVIHVRKEDSKVIGLHSIALTNTPAVENMPSIVNSESFEGEHMEIMKKIALLLGLEEGANEEQIMEALGKMIGEAKELKDAAAKSKDAAGSTENVVANKAVCELLGLTSGADANDVAAKIMELKGGTIDGINVMAELKALKQSNAERDAKDAVQIAMKSGKIAPAQKEWAKSYALSDPKGFAAFVEKAPQVVPLGEIAFEDAKALKDDKPDEATLLACKMIGVSEEDLKKYGGRKE